jgi:ribosomal protein L11 methyltransferase
VKLKNQVGSFYIKQKVNLNMANRTWVEVEIIAPEEAKDDIILMAGELGSSGVWETGNSLRCYFKKDEWQKQKGEIFLSFLRSLEKENKVEFVVKELQEENWNEIWEKSIEPIEVGEKFVIKPTWKSYDKKSDRIVIQIDPKMSFGTGFHETTRLMLRAIEKYMKPGSKVLDVGTGTGILAIASIKLGAREAIGVDIDEWAYVNAIENAQLNDVKECFKIILGSIEDVVDRDFDFILANINRNAVVAMMSSFYDKLKDGGTLITSGYLDFEQGDIEENLRAFEFEIIDVFKEGEWIAIVSKK